MINNAKENESLPKVAESQSRFRCHKIVEFNMAYSKLDKHAQKVIDKIILDALSELKTAGIVATVHEES